MKAYLSELNDAALCTLPGTSAEILDQAIRDRIARGRITVDQWVEVITTAHALGIRTTSTIMYGHVETPAHWVQHMALLCRHNELSDDVGYRFSNKSWVEYPLKAERYAGWLRETWGDVVTLGWDFETFGEHHRADSGIFPFMNALHADFVKNKMRYLSPSEAIATFKDAHEMPLPEYGCTWAGDGGMDFFLGNEAQQGIFRLMHHIYNKAKLTKHPHLIDIAMWLLQSDNLHLIQWFSKAGAQAEVSAYFTPDEWWELGGLGILREQQRVYVNFLRAMDEYA